MAEPNYPADAIALDAGDSMIVDISGISRQPYDSSSYKSAWFTYIPVADVPGGTFSTPGVSMEMYLFTPTKADPGPADMDYVTQGYGTMSADLVAGQLYYIQMHMYTYQTYSALQVTYPELPPIVELSWEAPAHDGGEAITGYELHLVTDTSHTVDHLGPDVTSTEVQGPGYAYVVAVNIEGPGAPSEAVALS